jgi:hypothetical protein
VLEDRLAESSERALCSSAEDLDVTGTGYPLEAKVQIFGFVSGTHTNQRTKALDLDGETVSSSLHESDVADVTASDTDLAVEALEFESGRHDEVSFKLTLKKSVPPPQDTPVGSTLPAGRCGIYALPSLGSRHLNFTTLFAVLQPLQNVIFCVNLLLYVVRDGGARGITAGRT